MGWKTCICAVTFILASVSPTAAFISSGTQDARIKKCKGRYESSLVFTNLAKDIQSKYGFEERNNQIRNIMQENKYDERWKEIRVEDLPLVAEVFIAGSSEIGIIKSFKTSKAIQNASIDEIGDKIISPLVEVLVVQPNVDYTAQEIVKDNMHVVDVGQITSILPLPSQKDITKYASFLSRELNQAITFLQEEVPVNYSENLMQSLYERNTRQSTKNSSNTQLTKKQINKLASTLGNTEYSNHLQNLLKKVGKMMLPNGKTRLLDSVDVAKSLFADKLLTIDQSKLRIMLAASKILAADVELGGRFKRSACLLVSTDLMSTDHPEIKSICILNGGWIAVDESVKVGAEARKFAERSLSMIDEKNKSQEKIITSADERIMYRLECLAMGEELGTSNDSKDLELDVREALTALKEEHSPEGAQNALLKIGKWSGQQLDGVNDKRQTMEKMFSPWPADVLECATSLQNIERQRIQALTAKCIENKNKENLVEGRVDLTNLPAVCIDAKRATFRDDALGIRQRASTGRRVKKGSKWELLIHIADVSDLYVPEPVPKLSTDLSILRKTAEHRGESRYDLRAPLHILPPVALEALALNSKRPFEKSQSKFVNRCVTLWVYLDNKTGRVLDAGLERTLVKNTIALSFEEATQILDFPSSENLSTSQSQMKMLLSLLEQYLQTWKEYRLQNNTAAQNRERKLQAKELVSRATGANSRDDGARGSFQLSRGHRVVDNALDLHGVVLGQLLKKEKAPIPRVSGNNENSGGRLGSGPLRRFIDGMIQRQALAVLCGYGGKPMTWNECSEVNKAATKSVNNIKNIKSSKKGALVNRNSNEIAKKRKALRALASHFASSNRTAQGNVISALSTGNNNEVVLPGIGLVVRCRGVQGTLKSGLKVKVRVVELDADKGKIDVELDTPKVEK